jgi:N utilization substance protein A
MVGGPELLILVDAIQREKDIDREVLFQGLETALLTALRKKYAETEDLAVLIDRGTGEIRAFCENREIDARDLGRIAAQTAKQVIIQKIREAEQDVLFTEYEHRLGELLTGTIHRFEKGDIIISIGRGEGVLPRTEQVRGENYHVGDRIRAVVCDVRRYGTRVRIVLSRTHPDVIRRLFELEVPEIADGIIEIKHLAREPGYRTKIAVASYDHKIDCVGACVGVRGSRIRNIIDELNGEKIDIIRWNDSAEVLIMNSLKPAEIVSITLNDETLEAEVMVAEDQLSLAIGKKGQNVRLAAKLTGWEVNIVSADGPKDGPHAGADEAGDDTAGVNQELAGLEATEEDADEPGEDTPPVEVVARAPEEAESPMLAVEVTSDEGSDLAAEEDVVADGEVPQGTDTKDGAA